MLMMVSLGLIIFNSCEKDSEWDYPIKPGTKEWELLENHQAMVDVCQIPEHILKKINTNDLCALCLRYPLLYDVLVSDNYKDGLNKFFSDFNGIRELSKREENLVCLQKKYLTEIRSFKIKLDTGSDLDIGDLIMKISVAELLLGYSDFHKSAMKENQKKTLETLLSGYVEKKSIPESFQGTGFTTNLFARAHIIIMIDSALTEIFDGSTVLFSGRADKDLINTIDSLSYKLIK